MAAPTTNIIETRGRQMFPTLARAEIERLSRFGEPRDYAAGEALIRLGETGHGLILLLDGEVAVTQIDEQGRRTHVVTHGNLWHGKPRARTHAHTSRPAELSGRPSLGGRRRDQRPPAQ